MFSSTYSSLHSNWIYDVFLSYRDDVETWDSFIGHLYAALVNAGINVYKNDHDVPGGKDITWEMLNAIQGSRISLIVFSTKYAASKWCLEQLVEIMGCPPMNRRLVIPVFYEVKPSEVREQTGTFGKAFEGLIERFPLYKSMVSDWSGALSEAASIPGFRWEGR
ncbi:TIR-NBS disease resistance-like protein [Quillaja saponaria]|uniref:ADP-ribosyl cyclase/cyclic ADP-ribose hydrolase n=1 Tax=Quillaja saponaria TaxID=32244 RepID=A0AAD7LPN0_QUISA|nr:TIR-NBS disease resistance-like protein [Quillaja saponaria]